MTPLAMLLTAALPGLFVLLAGGYGVLYGMAHLSERRWARLGAIACYSTQCLLCLLILLLTPLLTGWKLFVLLSCIACGGIPPLTWRCLAALHQQHEIGHDR